MQRKVLSSGVECQKKFIKGIGVVDTFVGGTLGHGGRNRIIQEKFRAPQVINDGANIARRIVLEDPIEDLAAQTLIDVSMRTAEQAGDGTTTSVVIGAKLASEGIDTLLKEAGKDTTFSSEERTNAMQLWRTIQSEEEKAQKLLKEQAHDLKDEDLDNVISTSLENLEYGKELAKLLKTIGKDGYISVEDNWATKYGITTETTTGMRFLGKYASGFMTNSKNKKEAIWDDTLVLVTNEKIETTEVLKLLVDDMRSQNKRTLVIIDGYSEGENPFSPKVIQSLSNAVLASEKGTADAMKILAVKASSLTTDELTDVACFCDAKFFDKNLGESVADARTEDLGSAQKISVTDDEVNIIGGTGKTDERIAVLKEQMEQEKDQMFKEKIKRRIASLASGVGIIRVGASTESERTYLKEKLQDAVSAAKAAMEEGIVPGGGTALRNVAEKLGKDSILYNALNAPFERIRTNAGLKTLEVPNTIVDPLKVVRLALQNACSGAGLLITTDAGIADQQLTYGDFLEKAMRKVAPIDERYDFRDDENQDQGVPGVRN